MSIAFQKHFEIISNILDGYGVELSIAYGEITSSIIDQRDIYLILNVLKKYYSFEQLTDITAVDYLSYKHSDWDIGKKVSQSGFSRGRQSVSQNLNMHYRFEVIYQLLSFTNNIRMRVKCKLKQPSSEKVLINSVTNLWPSANWAEREVYDMFGIYFDKHPDLRRVLTDYNFIGHPLRKDFPQTGYVEMRYDENLHKVVYEQVEIDDRVNTARVIRDNTQL